MNGTAPNLPTDPHAPDFRRGFLRVPLAFWLEAFCRSPLTRRELQVVSAVIRESWGWNGKDGSPRLWTRPLSTRRIAELTSLSTDRLKQDVEGLVGRGVLLRRGDRYQVVPDPRAWRVRTNPQVVSLRTYPQTDDGGAPKRRSLPPKPQGNAAEMSLPAEADRKRKEIIKKRLGREAELSTVLSNGEKEQRGEAGTEARPVGHEIPRSHR
jgi:phage replication O-like protein O